MSDPPTPTNETPRQKARRYCETGYAKQVRLEAGVKFLEMAELIGVSMAAVHHWENANTFPRNGSNPEVYVAVIDGPARRNARLKQQQQEQEGQE